MLVGAVTGELDLGPSANLFSPVKNKASNLLEMDNDAHMHSLTSICSNFEAV